MMERACHLCRMQFENANVYGVHMRKWHGRLARAWNRILGIFR